MEILANQWKGRDWGGAYLGVLDWTVLYCIQQYRMLREGERRKEERKEGREEGVMYMYMYLSTDRFLLCLYQTLESGIWKWKRKSEGVGR